MGQHAVTVAHDPYSFQASHRRLAWAFRASVFVNVLLAVGVIVLCNLLATILPLKEVSIALVRADKSDDRIFRIEPIEKDVPGFELVMEARAARMVRLLLTIDSVTQTERFQEAFKFVEMDYYKRFEKERFEAVKEAMKDGLNRSITVESVTKVESTSADHKYAVDFIQTDKRKGAGVGKAVHTSS